MRYAVALTLVACTRSAIPVPAASTPVPRTPEATEVVAAPVVEEAIAERDWTLRGPAGVGHEDSRYRMTLDPNVRHDGQAALHIVRVEPSGQGGSGTLESVVSVARFQGQRVRVGIWTRRDPACARVCNKRQPYTVPPFSDGRPCCPTQYASFRAFVFSKLAPNGRGAGATLPDDVAWTRTDVVVEVPSDGQWLQRFVGVDDELWIVTPQIEPVP